MAIDEDVAIDITEDVEEMELEAEEGFEITDEQFTALMNVAAWARRLVSGEEIDVKELSDAVADLHATGISEDDLDFWLDDTELPINETWHLK